MWDVTDTEVKTLCTLTISTHTSRVGCDRNLCFSLNAIDGISTHTSRVGCDVMICFNVKPFHISTHTSRVGCDGPYGMETTCVENFYSHIPCGM